MANLLIQIDLKTRHLQNFWGASGDFWQGCWDRFLDFAGELHFGIY